MNSSTDLSPEGKEGAFAAHPPLPDKKAAESRGVRTRSPRVLRFLVVCSVLAVLLYFAVRNAPLHEIWDTLRQLKFWQVGCLLGLNIFTYMLITLRWWIIVRAENRVIHYFPLLLVRVAVFGVSYFTFGPHVGGEPLQILSLQRKYKLTFTHATASVIMDKLLELLANFFLLAVGLTAIIRSGILSTNGSNSWLSLSGLVLLCAWPPVHIIFLYRRTYPVSAVLRNIPFLRKDSKFVRFIAASERLAGAFCRRHLSALLSAIGISLFAAVGMVSEFALIASFLNIRLPFWQGGRFVECCS